MPRNTRPKDEKATPVTYSAQEMYHTFLNLVAFEQIGDANGSIGLRHVILTLAKKDKHYRALLEQAEEMAANNEAVTSPPTVTRSLLAYPIIHVMFVLMAREIQEESASLGLRLLVTRLASHEPYASYVAEGGSEEVAPEVEELHWPEEQAQYASSYTFPDYVWDLLGWIGGGNRGGGVRYMISYLVRKDKEIGALWRTAEPLAADLVAMLEAIENDETKTSVSALVNGNPSPRTLLDWRISDPEGFAAVLADAA